MQEILLTLHPVQWEAIKKEYATIIILKTKPERIFYPFRTIVYVPEIGVVGKFDCHQITTTIRPGQFAGLGKSCLTEEELHEHAAGNPLCGWYVKEGSVVEYEIPFPLERATDLTHPPESWEFIHRDEST